MIIKYKLEKEDYYDFNLHHMSHFKKVRKSILIQRFLIPAFATIIAYITYKRGKTSINTILPVYLIISVGWIALYPKLLQRSVNRRLNSIFKKKENQKLLEEKVLEVAEDGLYEILDEDKRVLSSKEIVDIVETDKNFYLYLPLEAAYIIPKKFIKDKEEEGKFLEKIKKLLVKSDLVN